MQDDDRRRLETLIEERSRELAMARDDLAAFSFSVSHDLRAPIRHIQSFAELLADRLQEVLDSQSRHYLEVISNAAAAMNRSADHLVALFKIDRSAMHYVRVDLNDLVNRVVNSFQPETTGRSVEWDIGDLPDVNGDLAMLQIVFTNLVSNALKFTRLRDAARIRIAVEESGSDDNGLIVLAIKDNGIGFDMLYQDQLFGIFQKFITKKNLKAQGLVWPMLSVSCKFTAAMSGQKADAIKAPIFLFHCRNTKMVSLTGSLMPSDGAREEVLHI